MGSPKETQMIPDEGWKNLPTNVSLDGLTERINKTPYICWDKSDGFLFIDVELNIPPPL